MTDTDDTGQVSIKLTHQEARRILMALTVRRHDLREDGYEQDAREYNDLAQRIARSVDMGREQ